MSCENCATLEARIAKLEAENAELRAALDSKNALLHRYGEPINTASSMVNLYIGTAIGIALAGPENVSKAQILGIAERLSAAWTVLDFEIARANRAGLVIHWQDTTGAQATYAILKDWYATPDPAALRHVIAEHGDFAELIEARQLGPGKKKLSQGGTGDKAINRLCADARPLRKKGMTWEQVADALIMLYPDESTDEGHLLLTWGDVVENLKRNYNRRYR